jgi:hypothetical protein
MENSLREIQFDKILAEQNSGKETDNNNQGIFLEPENNENKGKDEEYELLEKACTVLGSFE